MTRRPLVNGPAGEPVTITRAQVEAKAKTEAAHPTMSDVKSLPGYREHPDGSWSAPARGAWGEAMQPYWRADLERHQRNLGNGAYEPKSVPKGKTTMYADGRGNLWRLDGDQWVLA